MWAVDVTVAPQPPKVGMAFKTPALTSKSYHVAWIGPRNITKVFESDDVAWVIDASTDYGTFVPFDSQFWRIITPSKAEVGGPGRNEKGWKRGNIVSLLQRRRHYEILEVGLKCVLLRDLRTGTLQADSNANLERYYNKEKR